jgi:hypothetical protein
MDTTHTITLDSFCGEGDHLYENERLRIHSDGQFIILEKVHLDATGKEVRTERFDLPAHISAELLIAVQNIHNATR